MSGWSSDVCSSDLHHAAVAVHDRLGALVLEAAHGGALPRRRGRIEHVDLDHPAETVGLVRLGVHIEALVVLRPGVPALTDGVALVVALLGMAVEGAGEVAVKVLLGHQVGAPGRDAADRKSKRLNS